MLQVEDIQAEKVQDNDDENEEPELDRIGRLELALQDAIRKDSHGNPISNPVIPALSMPQLVALSWAAFCTNANPEEDASFRVQALDCDGVHERLKLALHMFQEKENNLRQKMEQGGAPKVNTTEGTPKGEAAAGNV